MLSLAASDDSIVPLSDLQHKRLCQKAAGRSYRSPEPSGNKTNFYNMLANDNQSG
jgi:hypothetical protein